MKIIKYKVIRGIDVDNLSDRVQRAINERWQPIGGVSNITQAVVLYDEDHIPYYEHVERKGT